MIKAAVARRRPSDLRARIIEAAERVFASKRYTDVTTEEIAAEADVTRSVLYRHFENKDDLFREAVIAPFVMALGQYSKTWHAQEHEPWDEMRLMRAMVGAFYDMFSAHRGAVLALASDGADAAVIADVTAAIDDGFAEIFAIGAQEQRLRGWFPSEGLQMSIRLAIGTIASAAVLDRLVLPSGTARPKREAIIEHVCALTVYGLRLRPDRSVDQPTSG
jgi:AcrR family transcriptional regulator